MIIQSLKNYKRPELLVFLRVCHQLWNQFQKKQSAEEVKRFLLHYFQLLEDFEYQALLAEYRANQGQTLMLTEKHYFETIAPYIHLAQMHLARIFFKRQAEHLPYLIETLVLESLERFLYLDLAREGHQHSLLLQQVLQVERNPIDYEALHEELQSLKEKGTWLSFIEEDYKRLKKLKHLPKEKESFLSLIQARKNFLEQVAKECVHSSSVTKTLPLLELWKKEFGEKNLGAEKLYFRHLKQALPLEERAYDKTDLLNLTEWILSNFPSYFEALLKRVDEAKRTSIERVELYALDEIQQVLDLFPSYLDYASPLIVDELFKKFTKEEQILRTLLQDKSLYEEDFLEDKLFSERLEALAKGESNIFSRVYDFSAKAQAICMKEKDASKQFSVFMQAYAHLQRKQERSYVSFTPIKEECLKATSRLLFFSLLKKEKNRGEEETEFTHLAEYSYFIELIFTLLQNAFLYRVQQSLYQSEALTLEVYEKILEEAFKKYFPYLEYSEAMLQRLGFLPHIHQAFYEHPVFFEEQLIARVTALGIWSLYQQANEVKEEEMLSHVLSLYKEEHLQDFFCQLADLSFPSPFDSVLQKRLNFQLAFYLHF